MIFGVNCIDDGALCFSDFRRIGIVVAQELKAAGFQVYTAARRPYGRSESRRIALPVFRTESAPGNSVVALLRKL